MKNSIQITIEDDGHQVKITSKTEGDFINPRILIGLIEFFKSKPDILKFIITTLLVLRCLEINPDAKIEEVIKEATEEENIEMGTCESCGEVHLIPKKETKEMSNTSKKYHA